ncbi:beta-galactosidase [Archangium violaceum]|uniref:beta-galactosidase n=1 Tax=Archangium violaceum TaxID=83451 RepID=UPI00195218EF|nr:beta-galactosidase [Archangium violaceum]QRN97701.1 beta-galactosidase [Archangium violaceum]
MQGRSARFEDGVLVVDGDTRLMISGDYPYYRDRPEHWAAKLAELRDAGIQVVTFSIPWRHHVVEGEGSRRFVFSGGSEDNRNVLGFIEQLGRAGLLGLARTGPFVHAEERLGGMPDHVGPAHGGASPAVLSADGTPLLFQGLALPSPLAPTFLAETKEWLRALTNEVLADRLHPRGPLLGVQLGHEGLYGDAALALGAFDYSEPALRGYRRFLARKYRVIDMLNEAHGTTWKSFGEVPPVKGWEGMATLGACLDWGEWCGHYLGEVLQEWATGLPGSCPRFVSLPPPERARLDDWLGRVRPERLRGLQYGFTRGTGNVREDDGAFLGTVLAARRQRGPDLEAAPSAEAYSALLALASGATGIGVPTGARGPTSEALSLLTDFLRHEGQSLPGRAHRAELAWGIYTSYDYVAAWESASAQRYKGLRLPRPARESLAHFADDCLAKGVDFRLVDLEQASAEELASCPRIILDGSFYMSEALQEKLADYVEKGGLLVVCGESPLFDERLRICEIFQERVLGHHFQGRESVQSVKGLPGEVACRPLGLPEGAEPFMASPAGVHGYRVRRGEGYALYLDVRVGPGVICRVLEVLGLGGTPARPRAFVTEYGGEEEAFLFALGRGAGGTVKRTLLGVPLELELADQGCAVVKVRRGGIVGCFVQGRDERPGRGAPVRIRYGEEELSTDVPCDLSAISEEGGLRVRWASGGAPVRVRVPGKGEPRP